jgi:hypothetical protein
MTSRQWVEAFIAQGPDYRAERRSVSEISALVLKAGRGCDLPLGPAEEMAALTPLLMSDPQLLAMCISSLSIRHAPVLVEGSDTHVVIERMRVAMAGPVIVDALVCGADRVIVHDADWPLLLWPILLRAERVWDMAFQIDRPDAKTQMITPAKTSSLHAIGPPQAVPTELIEALGEMAAKTFVPSTAASREAGAGAGLTDND